MRKPSKFVTAEEISTLSFDPSCCFGGGGGGGRRLASTRLA